MTQSDKIPISRTTLTLVLEALDENRFSWADGSEYNNDDVCEAYALLEQEMENFDMPKHTIMQEDFGHFLTYTGMSKEPEEIKSKLLSAYEANWIPADAMDAIAAARAEGTADERERCATIALRYSGDGGEFDAFVQIANAIRALSPDGDEIRMPILGPVVSHKGRIISTGDKPELVIPDEAPPAPNWRTEVLAVAEALAEDIAGDDEPSEFVVRFDVRDPEITHVYVACHGGGDYPIGVDGWHYKAFPARMSAIDILKDHVADFLLWPQKAPEER